MIFGQKMKLIIITIIKYHNSKHYIHSIQGRIQGGGAHPARAPPKIGKKYDFLA
jgi:hypothetical protein